MESIYFLYIFLSAVTAIILAAVDWKDNYVSFLHRAVVLWSGLVYTNFLFNWFNTSITPYIDWVISTPLLVLAFGYGAQQRLSEETKVTALAQAGVIITGFLAYYFTNTFYTQMFFVISSLLFLTVLGMLYQIGFDQYPQLYSFLAVTWIGYPLIFLYTGGNLVQATIPLVVLPIISKHIFSLMHSYKAE